jgi:hypothetical protein
MLLRRALPIARQKTARPFPIYEMGSSMLAAQRSLKAELQLLMRPLPMRLRFFAFLIFNF